MADHDDLNKSVDRHESDPSSETIYSTWGYGFCINDGTWLLAKGVQVDVNDLVAYAHVDQVRGIRATLAHTSQTLSPRTVDFQANSLRRMLSQFGPLIEPVSLINFRSTLTLRTIYLLHHVRAFLLRWHELGYDGLGSDVAELLESWTLPGGIKGDAVQRRDPDQGPLTDVELLSLNVGLAQAFEAGRIGLHSLGLSLLLSHTGRRPHQVAQMKLIDCNELSDDSGSGAVKKLSIPRVKETGGGFRESSKSVAVSPELALVLRMQCQDVAARFEKHLCMTLGPADREMLPLFPDWTALLKIDSIAEFRSLANTDRLHLTYGNVRVVLKEAVRASGVISERTGEALRVSPRRLRYTIGTRAAREGCGAMVIAEILDHTDTQNVGVYTKANPEHMAQVDAAVSRELTPIALAFRGRIVDDEQDAVRGDDPTSRVRHRGIAIATCGHGGSCAAFVPVPCYTCDHFQPWLHGPHQAVLDQLMQERQRLISETGDVVLASVNDRTIVAIREVIARCEEKKRPSAGADK